MSIPIWVLPFFLVGIGAQYAAISVANASKRGGIYSASVLRAATERVKAYLQKSSKVSRQIEKDPNNIDLLAQRGFCFCYEGLRAEAIGDFENYLKMGGDRLDVQIMLCLLYDSLFQFEKAIEIGTQAIFACKKHKEEGGKHQFKLTTFHRPRHCVHCKSYLKGLKNQGFSCTVCSAIVHSECASKIVIPCHGHSTTPITHNFAGVSLPYIGKCAQCLSVMSRRNGIQCLNCHVIIHEKCQDNFQQACTQPEANQMMSKISLADVYASRGLAYYHWSKYELAVADFCKAIELDDQSITNYSNRGFAYFFLNQFEDCIKDLTLALDKGLEEIYVLNTRASAYQLLGLDKEAEADRQRAYQLDNTVPVKVFPYPLSKDLTHLIFSFLTNEERFICSQTCKQWNQLISQHIEWKSAIEILNWTIAESTENLLTSKDCGGNCDIIYMTNGGYIYSKPFPQENCIIIHDDAVTLNNPLLSYHTGNVILNCRFRTGPVKFVIDTTMQEGTVKRFKTFLFFRAPFEAEEQVFIRLSVYPTSDNNPLLNPKHWKVIEDWFPITQSKQEANPNQLKQGTTFGVAGIICREEDILTRYLMVEIRAEDLSRNPNQSLDIWQLKAISFDL